MIGLPKSTEMSKQLPKKAIYAKFQMNNAQKEKMDADISRITIVNEISSNKVNVEEGHEIKSFFVISVVLKTKNYDERNIIKLSQLIPQNLILILQYEDIARLAVYRSKLMQTEWKNIGDLNIKLEGLNLDKVWENIIVQIGNLTIKQGNTLEQQIAIDERKQKLVKEIELLEKMARSEKQPKKKFEIVKGIQKLKQQLGGLI